MASGTSDFNILNEALSWLATVTNGQLTITQFPVGAIVGGPDQLQALSSGTVEVCRESPSYFTGSDPAFALVGSGPGVWESPIDMQLYMSQYGGTDLARKLYGQFDVYYLGPKISNAEPFLSKKPIGTYEDFKGLKVRTLPGLYTALFAGIGAIPQTLDASELYSAMDTGVIDGLEFLSVATDYGLGLQEVSKYILYPSFHTITGADDISVNMGAWSKLPDNLKAAMQAMIELYSRWAWDRQEAESYVALQKFVAAGVIHQTWSSADFAKARAVGLKNMADWASKSPMSQEMYNNIVAFFEATGRPLQ